MERRKGSKEMERFSLDSSVVVKWFSEEEDTDKALEIRDAFVEGRIELIVTPLLFYEVVNALRYKPDFDLDKLERAIDALFKLHIKVAGFDEMTMKKSAEIAFNAGVTIYDAIPVAVAEMENAVCITADERTQYSKLRRRYPIVLLKDVAFFR